MSESGPPEKTYADNLQKYRRKMYNLSTGAVVGVAYALLEYGAIYIYVSYVG